jgi:glycine betaine/choline ABC-type transport system substrate-binding protein
MKKLIALLAVVGLTACGDPESTLKIGSKDFSESKILSEMIAALAEAEGIPVTRRIGLGPTRTNLEALKRGDIDLYPEYNGTGLVMLGQPALTDGDEAMDRVRSLYEPLNLAWGKRFGFANNYGLAMRKARAEELGVSKISDLVGQAGDLTIGIDANFQSRPLDGFQPMTARYGMSFGDVETVPPEERTSLYDRLLRGEADVIEVFTTDGQIADLGLVLLEDDLDFFPVYQAAPLVRTEALVEFSALRDMLNKLAGALDAETMQALNSQVDQASRAPRDVARAALADLGLLDTSGDFEVDEPLVVSHAPLTAADAEAGRALSAVRQAFPARRVQLVAADDPLAAVGRGEARIGLVAAAEFAEVADGGTTTRPFEAAGVVGQT